MARVVIDGTIYVPSVQADGTPSEDWIPLLAWDDLFLEEAPS